MKYSILAKTPTAIEVEVDLQASGSSSRQLILKRVSNLPVYRSEPNCVGAIMGPQGEKVWPATLDINTALELICLHNPYTDHKTQGSRELFPVGWWDEIPAADRTNFLKSKGQLSIRICG